MKKFLALIMALAMILSLVACGGETAAPEAAAPEAAAPEAAAPEAGERVLRIGLESEPNNMNPTIQADGQGSMFVAQSLYDGLWKMTADGQQIMMIAESYEIVDAPVEETTPVEEEETQEEGGSGEPSGESSMELCGKNLVVKIKDGLTFSDGNPITAEDVIWSFQYSATGSGAMRLSKVAYNEAYAEDELTVVFPLYGEAPTLIEDLALIYILEKAWCEQSEDNININPVSSGAFTLESWETGMGITLAKREDYHDAANVWYDKIDMTFIASEETRLLAFENGDFDLAVLSASSSIDEINEGVVDGASITVIPVQKIVGFQMDTIDHETFKDQRVRQAVCHAIDVKTLVTAICGSAYTVADSMLPSSNWAYVSNGLYEYDIELAKSLLAEAGYTEEKPFTFVCSISDVDYNAQLAEATQAMLAQANINMQIEIKDGATFMGMVLNNELEFTINTYMGSYDPAGVVNARRPGLPSHLSNYGDPALEALLEEACNSMEGEDARKPLWEELQTRTVEYANFVPLYEANVNFAVSAAVDGDSLAGSTLADGYLFGNYIRGVE